MAEGINMNVDILDIKSSLVRQACKGLETILKKVKPKNYRLNDEDYDKAMERATEEEMKLIQSFFVETSIGTMKSSSKIIGHLEDYLKFHPYMYPFVVSVAETLITGLKDRDMSKVIVNAKKDEYDSLADNLAEYGIGR